MLCVQDFEDHAMGSLPLGAREYYRGGAEAEQALRRNKECIGKFRIRPRVLRDVAALNTKTTVFGEDVDIPFGVSPTAFQAVAHPDGERGSAKAVGDMRGVFILSSLSNFSMEEVAEAAPNCIKWIQLYLENDRAFSEHLIQRAEGAGYRAIVLTVDSPVSGRRLREMRCNFKLPKHLTAANYDSYGGTSRMESAPDTTNKDRIFSSPLKQNLSWEDVKWFKRSSRLPLVVKGILCGEDAVLAVESGADAVFVSNHGGRQLDEAPATIEALPEVLAAVDGRCPVFVDGGFSRGSSIFKALALGARMVFVGRPALWGLSHSGQDGVKEVLKILKTELDLTMALAGCKTTADIDRRMVVHETQYLPAGAS